MRPFAQEAGCSGDTVVLIHGFAGNHAIWRDVVPILSATHRVLAYDLPGHGNSHPWTETGTPKIAVRALFDDLRERGIERFHLAGHSMGGAISALMALAEPDKIASLTLFAPGGFGPEINARVLKRYAAATTPNDIRACLEAMTGWDSPVDHAAIEEETALRAREGQPEALEVLANSITRDGRQGAIPRDQLAGLKMPVSVVWGTIDNVLPVSQTIGLPPHFALHILPNTGHMLPAEVPDLAAALIARNARQSGAVLPA
jgi:pyruvate dehydrogenase E2 component (dihydrolipoamide acetyltransferase)